MRKLMFLMMISLVASSVSCQNSIIPDLYYVPDGWNTSSLYIQYWGMKQTLSVLKPFDYEAWPLGSFYDKRDGTFNIVANYRPGHAIFTSGGAIKLIKINKRGLVLDETTICSVGQGGTTYCIGGSVAENGDYVLILGIRTSEDYSYCSVYRSDDFGQTWSVTPYIVDFKSVLANSNTQSGTMFLTSSNKLLCFVYNLNGTHHPAILVSTDNGKTWYSKSINYGMEAFMEGQFVEIDSIIYCAIRHVDNTKCYLIYSEDGGDTWSTPKEISGINPGNSMSLLYNSTDNTIELTWIDRNLHPSANKFPLMRSVIPVYEFISGNITRSEPIGFMDATLGMHCGYQRTLVSEDGVALLVYYDEDLEKGGCRIVYALGTRFL